MTRVCTITRTLVWVTLAVLLVVPTSVRADTGRVLRAGVHDDPPFVIKTPHQWTGISVELLRSIATEMGATLEITDLPTEQLVAGPLPDVDVVATLNVSHGMNARYDLSHGFYSIGLAIAVPEPHKESILAMVGRLISGSFLLVVVGFGGLLVLVGLLMWWLEKRPVAPLPKDKDALTKSLFWAFEPMIGYGASEHSTLAGRVLGTVWGLCALVMVSSLTANLAAQLTVRQLQTPIHGPGDLPKVRVGVMEHTAAPRFCDRRGISRVEFPSLEDALVALDDGSVDAVLGDAPNLAFALERGHAHLVLVPGTFANRTIAFGLMPGSPLRHEFNAALLKATEADSFTSLLVSYLGRVN